MTKFDELIREMNKKSRTISRNERYPKNVSLSPAFLTMLEAEYKEAYANGNRTVHSNFLKALSFEIDVLRDRLRSDAGDIDASDELDGVVDAIEAMSEVETAEIPEVAGIVREV